MRTGGVRPRASAGDPVSGKPIMLPTPTSHDNVVRGMRCASPPSWFMSRGRAGLVLLMPINMARRSTACKGAQAWAGVKLSHYPTDRSLDQW